MFQVQDSTIIQYDTMRRIIGKIEKNVNSISRKKSLLNFLPENDKEYIPIILSEISTLKKELINILDEYSENYKIYAKECRKKCQPISFPENPLEILIIYTSRL
jgi:ribosome recycling factor